MFEDNLQLNVPNFGIAGRPASLKPISDFAPANAVMPHKTTLESASSVSAQPVPDTAVLPDFLLFPDSVRASSLAESTPWSVRKPFLYMFLATFALVLAVTGFQEVLNRQFVQAASISSTVNKSPTPSPSYLNAKSSVSAAGGFQVASNLPAYLDIEPLKIHASVLSADFTENGNLTKSINTNDTAWNKVSAKPGSQGAMMIASNTYSCIEPNVFYNLKDIALGTDILVTNGAGVVTDYKVIRSQVYDQNKVNLETLSDPPVHYRPGLNIVTCAGDGQSGKRLVVNAVLYQ